MWDPRWPDLVHPFASAIDTPLPKPPECEHIMLGSKAGWVRVDARRKERRYDEYPPIRSRSGTAGTGSSMTVELQRPHHGVACSSVNSSCARSTPLSA